MFAAANASDPALQGFTFKEIKTDFEFLVNSNWFLKVKREEHLCSGACVKNRSKRQAPDTSATTIPIAHR
jgi:hypothetical protein